MKRFVFLSHDRPFAASWACLAVALFLCAPGAAGAKWLITGSCVSSDSRFAMPGVAITLHPESLTVVSDAEGDFLLPWSGERGWLTLVAPKDKPGAPDWCKRVALPSKEPVEADSTLQLGAISVTPYAQLSEKMAPYLPDGVSYPAFLEAPGPASNEPDTMVVFVEWRTDIWGKVVSVNRLKGADDPAQAPALEALFRWFRATTFKVRRETRCDIDPPFRGEQRLVYGWTGNGWRFLLRKREVHLGG